jgi:lipoprotein-anchoring transpeptidase ErfK/SrfK
LRQVGRQVGEHSVSYRSSAFGAALVIAASVLGAQAEPLPLASAGNFLVSPFNQIVRDPAGSEAPPAAQLRRQVVEYPSREASGTIIVDTAHTYLYYVLGGGKALRYGIGVGREGFTWSGVETISRMAEWPDWNPPREMIGRQPYLPRFMAGGPGNPLGARALYLGDTNYRIHGTNDPSTIGHRVSSGCIRLTNDDIVDLYRRAKVGGKVVVVSGARDAEGAAPALGIRRASSGQRMSAVIIPR